MGKVVNEVWRKEKVCGAELSSKGVCTGLGVKGKQIRGWDRTFSESQCVVEVLRGLHYVVLPLGNLFCAAFFSRAGCKPSLCCREGTSGMG